VIGQRLAGPVGEHAAREANDRVRQTEAGGFQMALHAELELPFRTEPGRVYNIRRSFPGGRLSRLHGLDMRPPGPMASLAIDALGKGAAKGRCGATGVGAILDRRVAVVAKHALEGDLPAEVLVVGAIVAGIHCPVTALFRIPADRKLYDAAVRL